MFHTAIHLVLYKNGLRINNISAKDKKLYLCNENFSKYQQEEEAKNKSLYLIRMFQIQYWMNRKTNFSH